MFVDKLSHQEKVSLIQLLTFIARSDGVVVEQEWGYLNRFASDHGLTYDVNKEYALPAICAELKTNMAKVVALQEVIKMALIDGVYERSEKKRAMEIADQLDISFERFKEIEQWAILGHEWVATGEKMIATS